MPIPSSRIISNGFRESHRLETPVVYRLMSGADLDQVLEIEGYCFPSPWSRESFYKELEKEYGRSMVAVHGERVAGYIIAWFIADELHIANLAVHPDFRRKGIAEKLLNSVIGSAGSCSWIGLEVRRSNSAAIHLYSKLGFYEIGVRRGYYQPDGEDAIVMARVLQPDPGV